MTNLEVWKPIPEFEEFYEISNLGSVRSLDRKVNGFNGEKIKKGKLLKQHKRKNGYLSVYLSKNGYGKLFTVHRLLAKAFKPINNDSLTVNHIDGNKQNNYVDNLEWCTMSEQLKHAINLGLYTPKSPYERGYRCTKEDYQKASKKRMGHEVTLETRNKIAKTLSKQIYCITDDILFDSLNEAVKYSKVPKTTFHRKLNSYKIINGKQYEYKS